MNAKNRIVIISLVLTEFILLNVILLIHFAPKINEFKAANAHFINNLIVLVLIYNFSWLLIILYIRDKDFYLDPNYKQIKNLVINLFFFIGFASTLVMIFKIDYFSRTAFLLPIFIYAYVNMIFHKLILKFLKSDYNEQLKSNILLISSSKKFPKLVELAENITRYGYKILGYLDDNNPYKTLSGLGLKIDGNIQDLTKVLDNYTIDEIFITISSLKKKQIKSTIKIADSYGVRVKLVPQNPKYFTENYTTSTVGDIAIYQLRQSPLDNFNNIVLKRVFDFTFALVAIILLSPLLIFISILIRLDSKGPVLYKPVRKGEGDGTFYCLKFRTMSVCDDPLNGSKSTVRNDPRITRVGKFLRKTDLDELPQFINVLKGEMSVIGPRPHRVFLQNDFRKIVNDYMVRSYVKPGITGWAQVNGWRGPTITNRQKKQRVHHDLWYIENWSFWLDIKIIFLTLFGKHHRENAF